MKQCVDVYDVIPRNERAVIVFSRGDKFEFDGKGSGETGNWIIDPERLKRIEKVVVYLRKPNESGGRVFVGNFTGSVPSDQTGRHVITFSRLEEICRTKSNWSKFAKTGSSPVRYI